METKLINLLKENEMTISSSESRRVIAMGAVRLNGVLITDMQSVVDWKEGDVLVCGKKSKKFEN